MKGKKAWPMPYMRGSHCFSTMIANALADSAWAMSEELVYILGCLIQEKCCEKENFKKR